MSKIKKDAPASANFVAVASHTTQNPTYTDSAPGIQIDTCEALPNVTLTDIPFTNEILGSGLPLGNAYIPSQTFPGRSDWDRLLGPNPGDWGLPNTFPNTLPQLPTPVTSGFITVTPQYWGVRRRTNILEGPSEFIVISPQRVSYEVDPDSFIARCNNENDARFIADVLSADARRKLKSEPECSPETSLETKRSAQMVTYDYVARVTKDLAGRVLTVLDATYVHEGQNKAVKQLAKREFRETLSKLFKYCHRSEGAEECERPQFPDSVLD